MKRNVVWMERRNSPVWLDWASATLMQIKTTTTFISSINIMTDSISLTSLISWKVCLKLFRYHCPTGNASMLRLLQLSWRIARSFEALLSNGVRDRSQCPIKSLSSYNASHSRRCIRKGGLFNRSVPSLAWNDATDWSCEHWLTLVMARQGVSSVHCNVELFDSLHRSLVLTFFSTLDCRVHAVHVWEHVLTQPRGEVCFFGKLPSYVKFKLFSSYCTSFYGCELYGRVTLAASKIVAVRGENLYV